jgi:hypothetical protein
MLELIGKLLLGTFLLFLALYILVVVFDFIHLILRYIEDRFEGLLEKAETVFFVIFGLPLLGFMVYCVGDKFLSFL